VKIVITGFSDSEPSIRQVRDSVFGEEQNVPREIDWDGKDAACVHALALDSESKAVGTGRLSSDGKIGRLAVLKAFRGRGVGAALLDALVGEARAMGLEEVHLHAQSRARGFYRRAGFKASGERFLEAAIEHVMMTKRLVDSQEDS
jgi:predicted GNAT family N-acyltransferase